MSRDRAPSSDAPAEAPRDPPADPAPSGPEATESAGQTPTAEGAPLVTEEGVDEGVADLVERRRDRRDA